MLLRCEHYAVLGFIVDLDLGVVWSHVALGAGAGQAGERDRRGVTRVAIGAGSDGAVVIWLAHGVALIAATLHGRIALGGDEGMRRSTCAARLKLFGEVDLIRS